MTFKKHSQAERMAKMCTNPIFDAGVVGHPNTKHSQAEALGCPMGVDLKEIIRDYINTYIKK